MKDKYTYGIQIACLLVCCTNLEAQDPSLSLGPWHLSGISGEIGIEGMYQQRMTQFSDVEDLQTSKYLIGGIKLNSNSYFWDPGILSVMLGGEFNPESRNETYLIIPDRSEVRTLKKIDFRSTLFGKRKLNVTAWMNMDQNYFNRESLTNILSNNRQWGVSTSSNNRILPFTLRYFSRDWEQQELEAERDFRIEQQSIQAKITKSFMESDKHSLSYNYDNYRYTYSEPGEVANEVHRVALNDQVYLDKEKRLGWQSNLMYYDQQGSYSFNKFDALEQLVLHLPRNVDLLGSYHLYRLQDPGQQIITSRPRAELRHKLYESLTTELFSEINSAWQTSYREQEFKTGANLRYTKKTAVGRLNLDYGYFRHHNNLEGEQGSVQIVNEPVILEDAGGKLLSRPFADVLTLRLTDQLGAILYTEGVDYFLNEVNDFIEIIRVPGGRIAPGATVLASYQAMQPGDSRFEANNHSYRAGLEMFKRLIEIYYKGGVQNFRNVESAEFLTLNKYDQHVLGGKIQYRFLTGGVEFDRYNSSLVPYERINYFLNVHFKLGQRLSFSANGSLRDYTLLGPDIEQRFMNVSGRASYQLARSITIQMNAGYLSQQGQNIDLGLLTGRVEAIFRMRKLYLKTGAVYYNRNYTNSKFTYSRAFMRLARVF